VVASGGVALAGADGCVRPGRLIRHRPLRQHQSAERAGDRPGATGPEGRRRHGHRPHVIMTRRMLFGIKARGPGGARPREWGAPRTAGRASSRVMGRRLHGFPSPSGPPAIAAKRIHTP